MPSIWLQPLLSLLVHLPLFLWICKIFRVVLDVVVHILDCSVGNYDPRMRIVFVHRLNSNFNSVLEVLKTCRDFQYKSNSRISSDPPFWFRCFVISWKGVFATSYCMLKFISIFLVTKYCPTSTTRINPASLQNLFNLFSGESDSTC